MRTSEQTPAATDTSGVDTTRRPWIAPELRTMRAGSAEAGPNPVAPEGAFALGS